MKRDPLSYEGEVSAEIRSTIRQGPLFLALIALTLFQVSQIWIRSIVFHWVVSLSFIFLYVWLIIAMVSRQLKAGPIIAWFEPRTVQVYVRVDEDYLVVRLPGKREAYRPSKLEWVDNRSFKVREGEIGFQLVFRSPDEATKVASEINKNFLGGTANGLPV